MNFMIIILRFFLNKFINIISIFVPCGKTISFCSFPDFTDNPYAVFKKMYTDERFRNYNLVWLIGEDKKCDYLKKEVFKSYPNVKIVSKSSLKGLYYLLISRYHICSHGLSNSLFFHQKKPKIVNLWHGMPLKVIGALDPVYGTTYPNSDLVIATNAFYASVMSRSLDVPVEKVLVTGYPRNDLFRDETNFFELFELDKKDYASVGAWLPTFHKNIVGEDRTDGLYQDGSIEFFDVDKLEELNVFLSNIKGLLVIKLHPMDAANNFRFPTFSNIIIVNKDSPSFQLYPFLGKCDYLLTDFSSVFIDFDILKRPMGFVFSDSERYKRTRGFIVDNIEDFLPGNIIKNYEEFTDFIMHFSNRYVETGQKYNKYKDLCSTERLLSVLFKNL